MRSHFGPGDLDNEERRTDVPSTMNSSMVVASKIRWRRPGAECPFGSFSSGLRIARLLLKCPSNHREIVTAESPLPGIVEPT